MQDRAASDRHSCLKAENLCLGYQRQGSNIVIEKVSLTIKPGQVTAIAGANGCGKSTLLKALARQIRPLSGFVLLNGKDIWQCSENEFARQVAYVPQSLTIPDDMLVADLVRLGRNPHQNWWNMNLTSLEREILNRAMERCGVTELHNKKLGQLSGGEKQRAIIAMALTQEPHYILLDEPTANLDFRYQQELIAIIEELRDHQIGIVTIFHDLNLTAQVADQVALIAPRIKQKPAHLLALSTVTETFSKELIKQAFEVDLTIIEDSQLKRPVYVTRKIAEAH